MNEVPTFEGRLYNESEWRRCWISNYHDGGWIVGEAQYNEGLHYLINSDNSGELIIHESFVSWQ